MNTLTLDGHTFHIRQEGDDLFIDSDDLSYYLPDGYLNLVNEFRDQIHTELSGTKDHVNFYSMRLKKIAEEQANQVTAQISYILEHWKEKILIEP